MSVLTPTFFTWSRVALAPLIVLCYYLPVAGALAALVLYIAAAVTDYVDGHLARVRKLDSEFGEFLDPVADKVLVVVMLLMLLADAQFAVPRGVFAALAALIILREVVQSALRDWMSRAGRSADVRVSPLSKTKTLTQMISLGVLIGDKALVQLLELLGVTLSVHGWLAALGGVMLGVSAVLGLVSLGQFLKAAFGRPAAPRP